MQKWPMPKQIDPERFLGIPAPDYAPEHIVDHYGCYHHPVCDTCPFEDCISAANKMGRKQAALGMRARGVPGKEAARILGYKSVEAMYHMMAGRYES